MTILDFLAKIDEFQDISIKVAADFITCIQFSVVKFQDYDVITPRLVLVLDLLLCG